MVVDQLVPEIVCKALRSETNVPEIWQRLDVPGSSDEILLISPDVGPMDRPFPNIVRCNSRGEIIWAAELPEAQPLGQPDAYVSAAGVDGHLVANSWSGFRVLIDPATGKIVSIEFTK
jgi:hypothetical protein